jgi:hypothetical protein
MGNKKQSATEKLSTTKARITELDHEREAAEKMVAETKNKIAERLSVAAVGDKDYPDPEYATDRQKLSVAEMSRDKAEGLVQTLKDALPSAEIMACTEEIERLESAARTAAHATNEAWLVVQNAMVDMLTDRDKLEELYRQHGAAIRSHKDEVHRLATLSGDDRVIVTKATLPNGVSQTLYHNKELNIRGICQTIRLFVSGLKQSAELSSKRIPQPGEVDEPESEASPDSPAAAVAQ